jgi:hypothetical protein
LKAEKIFNFISLYTISMSDEGDGIGSKVLDVAEDVGAAFGTGLKTLGKTAASQISGSAIKPGAGQKLASTSAKASTTSGNSIFGELGKFGKAATSQVSGSGDVAEEADQIPEDVNSSQVAATSDDGRGTFFGELKKFGQAAGGQISGHAAAAAANISQMKKNDDEFSQAGQQEVKNKIKGIYAEYEKKRASEKQQEQQVLEQEQVKLENIRMEQAKRARDAQEVNPAIAKTRAEKGKNYGAE